MGGSQDGVIIVVLQLDEFFAELTDVVVVHQRDCPSVPCWAFCHSCATEVIADHIPHEFGAVGVALLPH